MNYSSVPFLFESEETSLYTKALGVLGVGKQSGVLNPESLKWKLNARTEKYWFTLTELIDPLIQ